MGIEVIQKGMLTTVQDLGRAGHAAAGYPECGACDKRTLTAANLIVGNAPGAAGLEYTIIGPELRFTAPSVAAVCGMEAAAAINGVSAPAWTPLRLQAGDVLSVGALPRGLRGYIAVAGGIQVPQVLGSRSTDLRCGLGGLEGRALRRGDSLPCAACDDAVWAAIWSRWQRLQRRAPLRWQLPETPVIDLLPGPQADRFGPAARETLVSSLYTVAVDSNRMGLRLEGPSLQAEGGADILSDAILEGSVQVSSGGAPIVMLADHQTTGGYAKIAVATPTALQMLAQLRPGQTLRFRWVTPLQALRAYKKQAALCRPWMRGKEGYEYVDR